MMQDKSTQSRRSTLRAAMIGTLCGGLLLGSTASVVFPPQAFAQSAAGQTAGGLVNPPAPPAWSSSVEPSLLSRWQQQQSAKPGGMTAADPSGWMKTAQTGYAQLQAMQNQYPDLVRLWTAAQSNPASAAQYNQALQRYAQEWMSLMGTPMPTNAPPPSNDSASHQNSSSSSSALGIIADLLLGMFGATAVSTMGQNTTQSIQAQASAFNNTMTALMAGQTAMQKGLAQSRAAATYMNQTGRAAQLPGACAAASAAQAMASADAAGQSQQGGIANATQAARGTLADGGVFTGEGAPPLNRSAQIAAAASAPASQLDARMLYNANGATGGLTGFLAMLASPVAISPIPSNMADTAAGTVWQARYNAHSAQDSVSTQALGVVAGMNAGAVPMSAASSVAKVPAVPPNVASTALASSKPPPVASAAAPSHSTSSSGYKPIPGYNPNWAPPAGAIYGNLLKSVAQRYNVDPALMYAIQMGEGGNTLNALTGGCGTTPNGTPYTFAGKPSVRCTQRLLTYNGKSFYPTAKGLYQVLDSNIGWFDGGNLMLATTNAQYEFDSIAPQVARAVSDCNAAQLGVGCVFGVWNLGSVKAYVDDPTHDAEYVSRGYARYRAYGGTGDIGSLGNYKPGASGSAAPTAGNDNVSTAGLTALMVQGTFANADWYTFLATVPQTGLWRSIAYMLTIKANLDNQKRVLLEQLVMLQATQLARASQNNENINALRAAAQMQYGAEPLFSKIWNGL